MRPATRKRRSPSPLPAGTLGPPRIPRCVGAMRRFSVGGRGPTGRTLIVSRTTPPPRQESRPGHPVLPAACQPQPEQRIFPRFPLPGGAFVWRSRDDGSSHVSSPRMGQIQGPGRPAPMPARDAAVPRRRTHGPLESGPLPVPGRASGADTLPLAGLIPRLANSRHPEDYGSEGTTLDGAAEGVHLPTSRGDDELVPGPDSPSTVGLDQRRGPVVDDPQ